MVLGLDTGVGQNGLQLSQCCPDLMTAALRRIRAGTTWQVLIKEALRVLVKIAKIKPAVS